MADILKACTQHDSSLQKAGLLSLLAISGTVALLSFRGKGKLVLRHGGAQNTCTPSLPQQDFEEDEEDEAEENLHTRPNLDSSCIKENEPTRATLKARKRVRFAKDVVEPPSHGQHYRSKWRVTHGYEKHAHFHVEEPPCNAQVLAMDEPPSTHHRRYESKHKVSQGCRMHANLNVGKSPSNDYMYGNKSSHNEHPYKPTHKVPEQDEAHAYLSHLQTLSNSNEASQGCEMKACLPHPIIPSKSSSSIPANRLALYKGLRQSQAQYSLRHL